MAFEKWDPQPEFERFPGDVKNAAYAIGFYISLALQRLQKPKNRRFWQAAENVDVLQGQSALLIDEAEQLQCARDRPDRSASFCR